MNGNNLTKRACVSKSGVVDSSIGAKVRQFLIRAESLHPASNWWVLAPTSESGTYSSH